MCQRLVVLLGACLKDNEVSFLHFQAYDFQFGVSIYSFWC